jgi:hypothetical protein
MKLPATSCGVLKWNCAVALPAFALSSFGAVHLAFHPSCTAETGSPFCSDKQQGIQAKANKIDEPTAAHSH